jgi:hypothetical protein
LGLGGKPWVESQSLEQIYGRSGLGEQAIPYLEQGVQVNAAKASNKKWFLKV